jgi:hypothetical protein
MICQSGGMSTNQVALFFYLHRFRERKPMKKVTVLIYNENATAEKKELRVATPEEWSAILEANRGLPMCQRRCFIEDTFEDCGVIDRMFIEVLYEKYRAWDAERKKNSRNREAGQDFQLLSLDYTSGDEDGNTLTEKLAAAFDLEADVIGRSTIEEYRLALPKWKAWASELLEIYLDGNKRSCTQLLSEKYGVSEVIIRKRKRAFEKFTRKFFEDRDFDWDEELSQ